MGSTATSSWRKMMLDDMSAVDIAFLPMSSFDRELLHGNSATLVLAALVKGEKHPYLIRQELAEHSQGCLHLSLGNLYPLLAMLERRGLVRSYIGKGRGSQERRLYQLTAKGRKTLEERVQRWTSFGAGMNRVLRRARLL
jgi:PadR family transcriptional regulator, regulatory protein PadR